MINSEVFSSPSLLLTFLLVNLLCNAINVCAFASNQVTESFSRKGYNNDHDVLITKNKEDVYLRKNYDRSQVRLFLLNAIREQMVKDGDDDDDVNRIDLAGETSTVEESDAWESMLVDYLQNNNGIDDHRKYQSPLLMSNSLNTFSAEIYQDNDQDDQINDMQNMEE